MGKFWLYRMSAGEGHPDVCGGQLDMVQVKHET
jgi:hypothetical protein